MICWDTSQTLNRPGKKKIHVSDLTLKNSVENNNNKNNNNNENKTKARSNIIR